MYPGMKIIDIGPGTKHKFTVEKYKEELRRPYPEKDLYLSKAAHAEKKKDCTFENWLEGVINPNAIHDNTVSTKEFFSTKLTNQDCNFELESPVTCETCISSE